MIQFPGLYRYQARFAARNSWSVLLIRLWCILKCSGSILGIWFGADSFLRGSLIVRLNKMSEIYGSYLLLLNPVS